MDLRLAHSLMARNASLNTSTFGTKCKIKSVTLEPAKRNVRTKKKQISPQLPAFLRFGGSERRRRRDGPLRLLWFASSIPLNMLSSERSKSSGTFQIPQPIPRKGQNLHLRVRGCRTGEEERRGGGTYSRSHHSRKEEIEVDPCHLGPDERDVGFRYRLILIRNTKATSHRLQRQFPKAEKEEEGGGGQTKSKRRTHRNLVDLGKGLEHIQKQAKEVFSAYMLGHDAQQINIRSRSMDAQPSKGARPSVLVSSFFGLVLPE